MIFKTKQEAINHAGKPYIEDGCMVVLDYTDKMKELINEWFDAYDKEKGRIIIEEDEKWGIKSLYYYKEFKPFQTEEDKVYIGIGAFIVGWHRQYLEWMIERAKCDSDNYVFARYVTEEEIKNGNAILSEIARRMF